MNIFFVDKSSPLPSQAMLAYPSPTRGEGYASAACEGEGNLLSTKEYDIIPPSSSSGIL